MSARRRQGTLRLGGEDGSTAVEFAFCLPILLAMMIGIFQFGWVQHTQSSIRFALARAARVLMINPNATEAELQSVVSAQLANTTKAVVDVNLVKADTAQGRIATVSASYTSNFGVPMVGSFSIPYEVSVVTALRPIS